MVKVQKALDIIPESRPSQTQYRAGVASLLLLVGLAALSVLDLKPPNLVPASAPDAEFSSERAMKHLQVIARRAHPIGSPENEDVRNYLVRELTALGANPRVQNATAVNYPRSNFVIAGTVNNVVAKLEGTANTKSVLLVCHYDSVSGGPGAADDGAAVAALLETLRALKAGPPLKNDVMFLFTDGEEAGLLGARAFVDEDPWASQVGVVLNFEARGNRGPSIMFETSPGNGWLVGEFAKAAPHPLANSATYDIYKYLPNDTDFTVFKRAGAAGLNFAFIERVITYHTQLDTVENIDQRSMQHHGSYALALASHFAGLNLDNAKARDAIYFNTPGLGFVHYSAAWSIVMTILTFLLFLGIAAVGFRGREFTVSGVAAGALAFLLSMVAAAGIVAVLWWIIRTVHSGYRSIPQGDTYNSALYMVGFAAAAVATTSVLYIWFARKISIENLSLGALLWWVVGMILTSLFARGLSYLFTWPLLFTLLGMAYMLISRERLSTSARCMVVITACAVPGIILLTPMIYLIFVALTISFSTVAILMTVLLLGLLIGHLSVVHTRYKWSLAAASALTAFVLIVAAGLTSGFDRDHPKPNTVFYAMDADTGKAVWATSDEKLDAWTSKLFPAGAVRKSLPEFPPLTSRPLLQGEAPSARLKAPNAVLVENTTSGDVRTLHLRIEPAQRSAVLSVSLTTDAEVIGVTINRKPVQPGTVAARPGPEKSWILLYYAPPQNGVDLALQLRSSQPVSLRVVERSNGLPEIPGSPINPRPEYMIATPYAYSDSTMVSKSFTF